MKSSTLEKDKKYRRQHNERSKKSLQTKTTNR